MTVDYVSHFCPGCWFLETFYLVGFATITKYMAHTGVMRKLFSMFVSLSCMDRKHALNSVVHYLLILSKGTWWSNWACFKGFLHRQDCSTVKLISISIICYLHLWYNLVELGHCWWLTTQLHMRVIWVSLLCISLQMVWLQLGTCGIFARTF